MFKKFLIKVFTDNIEYICARVVVLLLLFAVTVILGKLVLYITLTLAVLILLCWAIGTTIDSIE